MRVLELGAGIGNMTQHLARGRKAYVASDIDAEHMARLRVRSSVSYWPNM
jgi:16S rRNA A1518/A1519 N6-dimethyltransferase RsmA/KsgA/DIM1 with predicted DNA glycosylase/AP lyase activity